jgi:ketosteroid isomerase-like protein
VAGSVRDNPPTMPEEAAAPELAERWERHVEAFNEGDFDFAASLFAPDALFYPRAAVGVLEGREAIRSFFEDWRGTYEELSFETKDLRDLGSGVTFSVMSQRGRLADTAGWMHDHFALVDTWADGLIEKRMNFANADEARAAAEHLAHERDHEPH